MRIIFLLIFVYGVWCEKSEKIILDTNVCTATLGLFDKLQHEIFKQNSSQGRPSYSDIWTKLNSSKSIEVVISKYLTEADRTRYKQPISITRLILELKEKRPQTVLHIPVYIYNEAVNGISSKMNKDIALLYESYIDLFVSMPVKTIVDNSTVIEGEDLPTKCRACDNDKLFQITKNFLLKALRSNKNLEGLIKYLSEEIPDKKRQTEDRLSDLNEICENVKSKIDLWDTQMKIFLSNNGVRDYKTDTDQFQSVAGKISMFSRNKFKGIDFNSPVDVIANRLIKFKEEFDFFDLQIYLYAKEKNAHILTLNTQAFQEVNDPVFLDYFRTTKILNPSINFQELADLDGPSDCKTAMETVIKRDFESDCRLLTNFKSIINLHRIELDVTRLNSMFENIFCVIREQLLKGKSLNIVLRDIVFTDALDLLKIVDNQVKIDQQAMFNSDSTKVIVKQTIALRLIDKFIFNSTLGVDDFIKTKPIIDAIPKSLHYDKRLVEGVKKSITHENCNLIEFLKIFKNNDKSVRTEVTNYAKMLYYESNFRPENLDF